MSRSPVLFLALSALLAQPLLAAAPGAAPAHPAAKKAASTAPAAAPASNAVGRTSYDIGLSLAKPLKSANVTRAQISTPDMIRGLQEALSGKPMTEAGQASIQAFLHGGAADQKGPASYNLGLAMGQPLHASFLTLDTVSVPEVVKGLGDALDGKETTPEMQQALLAYLAQARQGIAQKNHAKAEAFLAANAGKPGVMTTASGLQYRVVAPGSGTPPKATDTVSVRYRGTLIDGTEFDGTDMRNNEPASFQVNGVIQGWQEALQLMKPGAKFELFIPPALGYDLDSEDPIPPGALLLFTVELLKIGA